MKVVVFVLSFLIATKPLFAESNETLLQEIKQLRVQTSNLEAQVDHLKKQSSKVETKTKPSQASASQKKRLVTQEKPLEKKNKNSKDSTPSSYHSKPIEVHVVDGDPDSASFYPTALLANNQVVTYIAGTPVVTTPYLGARPAFDGSDYIVNISSINRDIRLMQQRRRLYRAYQQLGYPIPSMPIIALSGKAEPVGELTSPYFGPINADLTLGSSELDVTAALNNKVEGFMAIAYDDSAPPVGGPRISNSAFRLSMGFVNIGDLDISPYYFTAGQLYVPFGRFSSAMISSPVTLRLARTKSRPFILGYKSQEASGPFAALYGFRSDLVSGRDGAGGINLGYLWQRDNFTAELGASYLSSIGDSSGMQDTGSAPFTTFGGFGSITNGSEDVNQIPVFGIHGNLSYDRYNLTAEWVSATKAFPYEELSFNDHGAKPSATQLEAGVTFMAFSKPASVALGYQWSRQTLALNLPARRVIGVFNISIWKDTVESLEYRHDSDFGSQQYANGIAAPGLENQTRYGTGRSADSLTAQIGIYF